MYVTGNIETIQTVIYICEKNTFKGMAGKLQAMAIFIKTLQFL